MLHQVFSHGSACPSSRSNNLLAACLTLLAGYCCVLTRCGRGKVLERWTNKALADPLVREAAILAAAQHPSILQYLVRPIRCTKCCRGVPGTPLHCACPQRSML